MSGDVSKFVYLFVLIFGILCKVTSGLSIPQSDNVNLNEIEQTELLDDELPQNVTLSTKEIKFLAANTLFDSNKRNVMEETIQFLDAGQKSLNLSESRDIVIVVGNTGSGKTTFSHFIATDNENLTSVKTDDDPYSDDFIIEDTSEKISGRDSTTVSKTLIPELIVDEEGIVWYDCPGFSDTRNTTVEIAVTYFVKRLIDHATRIKLVFVVNHGSVINGVERSDFAKMVKHGDELIRNVDNYKLSIALVVSKVEAYSRSNLLIPHWVIVNRTGSFIEKHRDGLINNGNDENSNVVRFLTTLLDKDSSKNYTKIGAFFRPDKPGRLSEIPLLRQNREQLRNIIKNNLNYSEKFDADFGYSLSDKAQNDIVDLAQLISNNVTESVRNIDSEIIPFYKRREKEENNLVARKSMFDKAATAIDDLKENIDQKLTLKTLIIKLKKFIAVEKIFIPKSDVENLAKQQEYLEFLNRVSTKLLPVSPSDWIAALQKTFNYISTEENWYTFLIELYEDLSDYEIQKNLQLYNKADLSMWGKDGGAPGIFITYYNFKQFLQLHPKFFYLLKDIRIDDTKLATINSVLDATLRHTIEYQCLGDKMVVKREYLRLNEIDLKKCGSNIKNLQFYALNTFFADTNLDFRGDGREVAIIANKLVVTTNIVFSLQGEDSTFVPKKQPEPDMRHLAGNPGVPGEPGTNGVNFIGLFSKVINGDRLTVNAYGGAGSPGQEGGKALPRKPERPTFKLDVGKYSGYKTCGNEFKGITMLNQLKKEKLIRDYVSLFNESQIKAECAKSVVTKQIQQTVSIFPYFIYTECCASDGLAGAGGVGGHGGGVKFISLKEDGSTEGLPNMLNNDGKNGTNGKQVEPCETKKFKTSADLLNIWSAVHQTRFRGFEYKSYDGYDSEYLDDELCARDKYTEYNTVKQNFPASPLPFRPYEPIIAYQAYLREKLETGIQIHNLADLYDRIQNNPDVQNTYTVHGFARELQSLENHFYALNNKIDFIPFYENYLERIESYSQLNSTDTNSDESKKVLIWLYTSALTKVQGLKTNRYTSLVIDIQTYFDSSIRAIQELGDLKKEKIINKTRDDYKIELDAKIEEATKFIDNDISPGIDHILKGFDKAMDELLEETIAKQNETKKDIKKLEENKKKMEKNIKLRLLTGIFKGIGQCVSFIGPIGTAIGSAINTASSIGDSFIVDPDSPKKRFTLPEGLRETIDKIGTAVEKTLKERITAISEQIDRIETLLNKAEGAVVRYGTKKTIYEIRDALNRERKSESPNEKEIEKLNKNLIELAKDEQTELKKSKEKSAEIAGKVFKGAGHTLTVIKTSVELYNSYKDSQDKIDEVSKSIEKSKNNLLKYEIYEREIYETMLPMLFEARNDIKEIEMNLGGKSAAGLGVQKWKVQSKLRNLKGTLVSLTKEFEAEESLTKVVEELNEAIVTLIDIYDRIQAYEEQQKLVVYIGALHSKAFDSIEINDIELKTLITDLQIIIKSNIILFQYLNAVHNFKQSVFPFAAFYLDVYNIPTLNWNEALPEFVRRTTEQIGSLSDKIKELNTSSININDVDIKTGYFNGDNEGLDPFYVWKYEEHKKDISDLLSGKKVFLRADVTRISSWSAVKFSRIGIDFRINVKNDEYENRQAELKKLLNRFYITMTHSGNSFYRCNSQFYTISSPSQTIWYSYDKTENQPTTKNTVYEKLRDGNIVLSPYTMWTIQLERGNFTLLEKFSGLIDIELYGYGQYVTQKAAVCNTNLQKYYQLDESLSEVNNIHEENLIETPSYVSNYLALDYLITPNEE